MQTNLERLIISRPGNPVPPAVPGDRELRGLGSGGRPSGSLQREPAAAGDHDAGLRGHAQREPGHGGDPLQGARLSLTRCWVLWVTLTEPLLPPCRGCPSWPCVFLRRRSTTSRRPRSGPSARLDTTALSTLKLWLRPTCCPDCCSSTPTATAPRTCR